jgi:two-component sensor histidine kinase
MIRINAREMEDRLEISIADDGVGLPEGFDYINSPSLGLRLVTILIEQLSGTIELDRQGGTAFTIVVKEKE